MWYLNRIYVQSNHFSHFCPEIIWSIEIHGDSCGLRTSYSVSRNLLSTFNRWILWKLCWDTLCLSILHRHVPETEFGTGSMKYLPDFWSTCKWPSYSARWVAMDIMRFNVIQTGLFSETIRIFGIEWSHWTILHQWVIVLGCKVSLISPLPRCVCVGGGGGGGGQIFIPWSYLYF